MLALTMVGQDVLLFQLDKTLTAKPNFSTSDTGEQHTFLSQTRRTTSYEMGL